MSPSPVASALAGAFLGGDWTEDSLVRRGRRALASAEWTVTSDAHRFRWLRPLTRATLAAYLRPPRDRPRELAAWLDLQPLLSSNELRPVRFVTTQLTMGKTRWPVRPLADVGELASWLRLDAAELADFADPQSRHRRGTPARARHYRVAARVSAGGNVRVLEAPKERLKTLQRLILRDILSIIPVHDAAHGAEPVAHLLTGLCTTSVAAAEWAKVPAGRDPEKHWRFGRRLDLPHLAQGAPTSPALANLAAWSLDLRLAGLARSWQIDYSRYADDLVFSGPSLFGNRSRDALLRTVADIVAGEGFGLNEAKTRSRSRGQRQEVLGIVVNQHPAVSRRTVEELRAVLHNCIRFGPASQNRAGVPDFRAHLQGRISWVRQVQPARGEQLHLAFDAIDWSA